MEKRFMQPHNMSRNGKIRADTTIFAKPLTVIRCYDKERLVKNLTFFKFCDKVFEIRIHLPNCAVVDIFKSIPILPGDLFTVYFPRSRIKICLFLLQFFSPPEVILFCRVKRQMCVH
ncbi:hypothetical protein BBD46_21170 [Natrialba sp. SSL1]|nr:hypothetical protein BBD46_21170 [Natrialba sp. SSL1]